MEKDNRADQDIHDTKDGQSNVPTGHLQSVFIAGAWALIALLLTAIFWPNMTERMKFFTATLWVLVTAFAVISQAVIYRKQWQVMEAQWRAMERQTEYAQRAYLSVPIANLSIGQEVTGGHQYFLFMLRVKNCGNTPAYDVMSVVSAGIAVEPPDPILPTGADLHIQMGLLSPNAEMKHWVRAPEPSGEQNRLWIDGKLRVYCSGVITYRTFGKTRTTKFCVLRRPGSMEVEPYGKWSNGD